MNNIIHSDVDLKDILENNLDLTHQAISYILSDPKNPNIDKFKLFETNNLNQIVYTYDRLLYNTPSNKPKEITNLSTVDPQKLPQYVLVNRDSHWLVAIIDHKKKLIYPFNSLRSSFEGYANIKDVTDSSNYKIDNTLDCTGVQDADGINCGFWVCKVIELFEQGKSAEKVLDEIKKLNINKYKQEIADRFGIELKRSLTAAKPQEKHVKFDLTKNTIHYPETEKKPEMDTVIFPKKVISETAKKPQEPTPIKPTNIQVEPAIIRTEPKIPTETLKPVISKTEKAKKQTTAMQTDKILESTEVQTSTLEVEREITPQKEIFSASTIKPMIEFEELQNKEESQPVVKTLDVILTLFNEKFIALKTQYNANNFRTLKQITDASLENFRLFNKFFFTIQHSQNQEAKQFMQDLITQTKELFHETLLKRKKLLFVKIAKNNLSNPEKIRTLLRQQGLHNLGSIDSEKVDFDALKTKLNTELNNFNVNNKVQFSNIAYLLNAIYSFKTKDVMYKKNMNKVHALVKNVGTQTENINAI
jgi:hypothetical protein